MPTLLVIDDEQSVRYSFQRVFEADNAFQLIAKHMQEPPVPPSRRSGLPVEPPLERLVLDCLAKSPEGRPQSAAELDRRLGEIGIEPWSEEEAKEWWSNGALAWQST